MGYPASEEGQSWGLGYGLIAFLPFPAHQGQKFGEGFGFGREWPTFNASDLADTPPFANQAADAEQVDRQREAIKPRHVSVSINAFEVHVDGRSHGHAIRLIREDGSVQRMF